MGEDCAAVLLCRLPLVVQVREAVQLCVLLMVVVEDRVAGLLCQLLMVVQVCEAVQCVLLVVVEDRVAGLLCSPEQAGRLPAAGYIHLQVVAAHAWQHMYHTPAGRSEWS
jgi:hypothetical protein